MGVINKVVLDGTTHTIAASALAICDTAAASSAKVATVSGNQAFTLIEGTTIQVKFEYSNTATNPTLNINGTGAKPIYRYGAIAVGNQTTSSWMAGSIISFTYNGTGWIFNGYQTGTGGGTAEQQNADWTETTGVTSILHKPTEFNPTFHASSSSNYGVGNTGQYGHVKLSNAIASEAGIIDGVAATPLAVNNAKEYALNHSVPLTRTINDKPLSSDIQLDYNDVGAPSLAAVPQISAVTSSGVNIADVTINGVTTHLYAPASGSGGGEGPLILTVNSSTIPFATALAALEAGRVVMAWSTQYSVLLYANSYDTYSIYFNAVFVADDDVHYGYYAYYYSDNSWNIDDKDLSVFVDATFSSGTKIGEIWFNGTSRQFYVPPIPTISASQNVTVGSPLGSITIDSATTTFYNDQMIVAATASWSDSELYAFNITSGQTNEEIYNQIEAGKVYLKVTDSNWIAGRWRNIAGETIYNYDNNSLGSYIFTSVAANKIRKYRLYQSIAPTSAPASYDWIYSEDEIGSSDEIFFATYGVTSYASILEAYTNNYQIILQVDGEDKRSAVLAEYDSEHTFFTFSSTHLNDYDGLAITIYTVNINDEWDTLYRDTFDQQHADWAASTGITSILNKPTSFNPTYHASSETTYGVANYYDYGHVKLSDYIYGSESVEDGVAVTPSGVQKVFESINATSNYSSGAYLGSITINGNTTDFFSPSGGAPVILSSFESLDEDDLLHISANFSNGIPVKVHQNSAGFLDEENIDYLDLVDVAGNNGDGVPSYLTFIGTTSTQIHRAYYDNTASGLIKWVYNYTQIPTIPTATAAVSSGDRLLVQTVPSTASDTSGMPVLVSSDTYEIKTTSIEFGNSTTQFLANDGQWRTPAGGGGGSAGGTVNYTNGVLEIVFYNS